MEKFHDFIKVIKEIEITIFSEMARNILEINTFLRSIINS